MKKLNTKNDGMILIPTTKKEEMILSSFKYDCIIKKPYGNELEPMLLPDEDDVNGYLWPDNMLKHGFDYEFGGLAIPSNLAVLNAYYTVKSPIKAAKWRKRHGVVVANETYGNETWGYITYHIPSFK